jgi:hypothetical protein
MHATKDNDAMDRGIRPDERVWKRCARCSGLFQACRGEGWPERPAWCGLGCWSHRYPDHKVARLHVES